MEQGSKDVTRYIVHTKSISQQMSRYIRMTSDLYHAALNYVISETEVRDARDFSRGRFTQKI